MDLEVCTEFWWMAMTQKVQMEEQKHGDENTGKKHVRIPHSVYPDTAEKSHAKNYMTDWLKGNPINAAGYDGNARHY